LRFLVAAAFLAAACRWVLVWFAIVSVLSPTLRYLGRFWPTRPKEAETIRTVVRNVTQY
jgi:hypothetical protein